jgi:hypothetical protein
MKVPEGMSRPSDRLTSRSVSAGSAERGRSARRRDRAAAMKSDAPRPWPETSPITVA